MSAIIALMNVIRYINTSSTDKRRVLTSADKIFKESGWAGHQLGIVCFGKLSQEEWAKKVNTVRENFKLHGDSNATCKHLVNLSLVTWFNFMFTSRPIDTQTFTLIVHEHRKTIVFISNHALCDGHKLFKILGIILDFNNDLVAPKYTRFPVISDIFVLKYVLINSLKSLYYKPTPVEHVNKRFSISIPLINKKRFSVYATVFKLLFSVLDKSVKSLRIAFTVAWDDDNAIVNNKIGCIIVDVPRSRVCEKFFVDQFSQKKQDALTSYEIMRSYNIPYIRKKFCYNIDGVFTAFLLPYNIGLGVTESFGGFCGNLTAPFYINAMSCPQDKDSVIRLSIQTCSPLFDAKKFLKYKQTASYNDIKFPKC